MSKSSFYSHLKENQINKQLIQKFKEYSEANPGQQIYLISSPLGEKYSYPYEGNVIVVLSPKHKIVFLDLGIDEKKFTEYFEDFIEDLNSISDKYEYKEYIGRPRHWQAELITKSEGTHNINLPELFEINSLPPEKYRLGELLISLLVGSINDISRVGVSEPKSILDKVRQNIVLFDGDQTRFVFQKFTNKKVSIQGLSGTGKTELLLHKLKELYLSKDKVKIFFTCHNIALANSLKSRIPTFFNFMKVEKQIEWNSKLWVDRAWGSEKDPNSGLYSYLCAFYDIPFKRYSASTGYKEIFSAALDHINSIDSNEFDFAFDYILIDERQDFPEVFFELCEKISKRKVFIAGDIFQDIFENTSDVDLEVDIILNKCYRTDPRTLMFAHSIGLGLFEEKKLNWFEDSYWQAIGYNIKRLGNRTVEFSREPIRRFEDLSIDAFKSTIIKNTTRLGEVISILNDIKEKHSTVQPEDIAIIILGYSGKLYEYMDKLSTLITNQLGWKVNRAIESKSEKKGAVYITNSNNVKGLEFPFVICITSNIRRTYRDRNILYTMLTRSFIQSFLLVQSEANLNPLKEGLKIINEKRIIRTTEPTDQEKKVIKTSLTQIQTKQPLSYKEFLEEIFNKLNVEKEKWEKLEKAILQTGIEKFDRDSTIRFVKANQEFY